MSLVTVVGDNDISDDKKSRGIVDHGNAAVHRGAHPPMEHIQSSTGSHWMPPLGECLHCVAPSISNETQKHNQNTTYS